MSFFEYPHTRTYDNDLGWVIKHLLQMQTELKNFINFNTIKYADPIGWNITTQYEANTVVINPADGTAYISTQPVPSGVNIVNTDYWTPIFNYNESITLLREQIAAAVEPGTTATAARDAGDLVWVNNKLYKVLQPITEGSAYVEGGNVERVTIEDELNLLQSGIDAANTDIEDLETTVKTTWYTRPEWFGAVGDGVADDTAAFQAAVNEAVTKNIVLALADSYKVLNITIPGDLTILGGKVIAFTTSDAQTRRLFYADGNYKIRFINTWLYGSATGRSTDAAATLANMCRFVNCASVEFINCEISNHSQSDVNPDNRIWYLREIYAINCIECGYVGFKNCYIHDNHTEQISIGSGTAKTVCEIIGCRCDNNLDAYALFLLQNLKSAVVADNDFKDNRRTFVHVLSHNVTVANNRMTNSTGRCIGSEANATACRLGNLTIVNNYLADGAEGGIDAGVQNCIVEGNTIERCGRYAINFSGKITGNDSTVVGEDQIPYDSNVLMAGYNVVCRNNIIKDHKGPNVPGPVLIRPESNITNGATTYGELDGVTIDGNVIEMDYNNSSSVGICFIWGRLKKVAIRDNIIKNYNQMGIYLTYPTGTMTEYIKGLTITGNMFIQRRESAMQYTIRNFSCYNVEDVYVTGNSVDVPPRTAFFQSALLSSLRGFFYIGNNDTKGAPQTTRDTRFHENGNCGFSANVVTVWDMANLPNGLHLAVGDVITNASPNFNTDQIGICNTAGTAGTLTGCTATTNANSNLITVNNSNLLRVGDMINIAGAGNRLVVAAIYENNEVRLTGNATAAVTNAAVSYANPVIMKGASMARV